MAREQNDITKTIMLSGGMQDDVSEFHQADPTMAYIENGRFRKKDEIEKRLPDKEVSISGLPTEGQPLMLAAPKGEALLTLDPSGVLYSYDPDTDTSWSSRQTNILPYKAEVPFRTSAQPGLGIVQAGEHTANSYDRYSIVAYEIGLAEICVELRKPNGDLIHRQRYQGHSPKVREAGTDRKPRVYYEHNGFMYCLTRSGNGFAKTSVGSFRMTPTTPDVQNLISHNSNVSDRNDLRPGFSPSGTGHCFWNIDFGFPSDTSPYSGVVVWNDFDQLRIKIAKMLDYDGVGTEYNIDTHIPSESWTVLDCAYNYQDNETGILFSKYNPETAKGYLTFVLWSHDSNSKVTTIDIDLEAHAQCTDARAVNGSLFWDDSVAYVEDRWRFAATLSGTVPWEMTAHNYLYTPSVIQGHFDDYHDAFFIANNWTDHRLASEVTAHRSRYNALQGDEKRRMVFALEQWTPTLVPSVTGDDNNTPSYSNSEFASVPALIKPTTTIVVSTEWNYGGYNIIATLGAGQNKCINASEAEQNPHLNGAYVVYDDVNNVYDQPRICTRNILQTEDLSWHWSNPNNTGVRASVLAPGEAAAKIVKLSPATTLASRVYGETTLFASAIPSQYDGVTFGEQSVFAQPEITAIGQGGFDGTDLDRDYQGWAYEKMTNPTDVDDWFRVQVVTGFTDHQGHLHRSAPSIPVWVSGMDEAQNFDEGWVNFTNPLSAYGSNQKEYFVEVYVGKGEGAMHLAGARPFEPHLGAPYCDFIWHQRVNNDWKTPVRWSEVIYTEGNVLPSDPWPVFDDFVLTSNRMFAISSEVPGTVYYSKLMEENINPEFSAALVISLGRNRKLSAIGAIDDKVIIFTDDNEIFAIYDTGPDNTGANGDFIVDRLQTTVGCTDTQSLVEIPDGLVFYSDRSREFHILSRDLQVHDIGKPVEDVANSVTNVRAAIVFPDEHEIRWYVDKDSQKEFGENPQTATGGIKARPPRPRYQNTMPNNAVLVYNYHYKKWCVHSARDKAQHVVLYQNNPTWIADDWKIYQASNTGWGEEQHRLILRTPWIRVNQLQSFGRIDEVTFLAKYLSDWKDNGDGFESGDIKVTVRYDYEATNDTYAGDQFKPDVYLFRANAGDLGGRLDTEADLYEGGPVPYQASYGRCQFTVRPGRPKCQAIQFTIEDFATSEIDLNEPTDYVIGRGFSIAGADLIYKPKAGTGRRSTPQRNTQ